MGEVYRARDPRLQRDVAIKVSHERFSERFEREARAVAALNHPNICVLHDIGDNYLVMELVEGQTLAERMRSGAIPVDEAVRIAVQIADALEAAHEKGIVHRDLKPANVKIRPDGSVKVLDFGLAKIAADASAAGNAAEAPTVTAFQATQAGVILGTLEYMSPEQARGQPVDRRTDIWAFGVVLYEMVSGRRLFAAATVSDTLVGVLKGGVDWEALPCDLPANVRRLLRRCLERDAKRRLRDIGDARIELGDREEAAPPAPPARGRPRMAWAAVLGGIAIGGALVWGGLAARRAAPRPVTRWTMAIPEPRAAGAGVALSRDGTLLAYAEWSGGTSRIMLRRTDQFDARPIAGTAGGVRPFFSPGGQWVAYFTNNPGALRKSPVAGGTSVFVSEASFLGGSWGEDDSIVFAGTEQQGEGLMRVAGAGGAPQRLTTPDAQKGETGHQWPQILPGGRAILFTIDTKAAGFDARRIAVLDLKTGAYRVLLNGGSAARYISSGHVVYVRGGTMFAVPFNLRKLEVTGPETPVADAVYYNPEKGFADYSISESGLLVYAAETRTAGASRLEWVERDGTVRSLSLPAQQYQGLSISPGGREAALALRNGESGSSDIWIVDLTRDGLTRLTSEGDNYDPVWSADGRRIVFRSRREKNGLYWMAADGSGKAELLRASEARESPAAWSPDGQTLLFMSAQQGRQQIGILPTTPNGAGEARPFLKTSSDDRAPRLSPDGRWIAYDSDQSGKYQVYVRPYPGPGGVMAISSEGGESPHWSRGGHELVYRDLAQNEIMAVEIQTDPVFHAGRPQPLAPLRGTLWDITPDGKRFLVVSSPDTPSGGARLQIVTDWFDELRRRVAGGK